MDRTFYLFFVVFLSAFSFLATACMEREDADLYIPTNEPELQDTIRYLALGDSYTIGESVAAEARFPAQLSDSLSANGYAVEELKIVATTGWTTSRLLQELSDVAIDRNYNLVSLLIGVNNQYRGFDFAIYEQEFPALLSKAIAYANGNKDRVFVVSIPDYAYTPFGQSGANPDQISMQLDRYNAYADSICQTRSIPFYQITDISRKGLEEPELVADDNLHPSGLMYQRWVESFLESVILQLEK
ncbi:MAG: SGNH/GDSL hydrolase family protein [Saprospiraceae bacterium]|nr:SGNH/GDSL hydrolase family protein [Saprospiraceae bacterium]